MSASIAGDRIRTFVERIERLKSEQDDLTVDIKNVYAEAKGEGFDKAALGEVVAIRRKQAKNPDAFDNKQTLVGLYMNAIEEAGLTQAPAYAHVRDGEDHAASSGEQA
jgi:uncharacterized protein (UPF0335 family)